MLTKIKRLGKALWANKAVRIELIGLTVLIVAVLGTMTAFHYSSAQVWHLGFVTLYKYNTATMTAAQAALAAAAGTL